MIHFSIVLDVSNENEKPRKNHKLTNGCLNIII